MVFEKPLTIKEVVKDIHRHKYLLPAIQREFEWSTEQIESLFDSLMRDYPVGAFLFWYVEKENIKNYKFYEFLRYYHERDHTHNPEANINGEEDIIAILDGQQRLTSLYIGLRGSYAYKLPRKRKDNDLAYPERELYINLLNESKEFDMMYDFRFLTKEEAENTDDHHYWFKVGNILNIKEQYEVNSYLLDNGLFEYENGKFANATLFKLHKIIHDTPCINYYQEKSQELDKVLNIFIRVNSGGTPLSYSDLLLSIATAQWETKDARKEIISLVDDINDTGDGFNFNKDLVLKTCLVLCDFKDIAFKVDNFNSDNMKQIENEWDEISQSIRLAVNLISSFGFNDKSLTANYVIIPIAYYFYKKGNPKHFVESSKFTEERKTIQHFTTVSLLKRVFGGQPDNVLRPVRRILRDNLEIFPYEQIKNNLKVTNKSLKFTEEEIDDLLWYKYGKRYTFSVLSLLYPHLDYKNVFHQDHIFPRGSLNSAPKLRRQGINEDAINFCLENYDYMGNLQLIEGISNQEKSDKPFKEWLDSVCSTEQEIKEYKQKHYIPNVDLDLENFEEFFWKREELIKAKLKELLLD